MAPIHTSFATGEILGLSTPSAESSTLTGIINLVIKFASWGWTIVAFLAGKLMSNDWIYASGIWLDKALFSMWNYMKNIANFVLWFMLVAGILKSLFSKDTYAIKKELPKYLLASIMINMSRFLMGALIDVSNVATAAVWAFPAALMGETAMKEQQLNMLNTTIPDKIKVNFDNTQWSCQDSTYTANKTLDSIRWSFNDMSWPLLFLGTSIYRLQSYCFLNQDITSFKNFSIGMTIKVIILVMFIAPLVALLMINLQRIFYLWLWIVFSPIIALLEVTKVKVDLGKMKETFSLKEIIGMIFTPVFTIWGLSLVLILSTGMYYVMWWTGWVETWNTQVSNVYAWAEITNSPNTSSFHNTVEGSEIEFIGDVFHDVASYAGGFIWYIIITSFTIMLLWAIVKISVSGSKIASGTYDKITKLSQWLATSAQIIPIGGGKMLSLWSLTSGGDTINRLWNTFTSNLQREATQNLNTSFYNSPIWKALEKGYGIPHTDISTDIKLPSSGMRDTNNWLFLFIKSIQKHINKDKYVEKLNGNSNDFLQSTASLIINNTNLKSNLISSMRKQSISVDEKITEKELLDKNSTIGKTFISYIRDVFANTTSTENIMKVSTEVITPEFSIYNKNK